MNDTSEILAAVASVAGKVDSVGVGLETVRHEVVGHGIAIASLQAAVVALRATPSLFPPLFPSSIADLAQGPLPPPGAMPAHVAASIPVIAADAKGALAEAVNARRENRWIAGLLLLALAIVQRWPVTSGASAPAAAAPVPVFVVAPPAAAAPPAMVWPGVVHDAGVPTGG